MGLSLHQVKAVVKIYLPNVVLLTHAAWLLVGDWAVNFRDPLLDSKVKNIIMSIV